MTEPIIGTVAEVLDSYRIVVNRGSDDGVEKSMRFQVYTSRTIFDPDRERSSETYRFNKAVVTPQNIHDKMSMMETESESYNVDITQFVANLPMDPTKFSTTSRQNKMKTDDDTDEDIEVVRVGDSVEQILDTEDEDVSEEVVAEEVEEGEQPMPERT